MIVAFMVPAPRVRVGSYHKDRSWAYIIPQSNPFGPVGDPDVMGVRALRLGTIDLRLQVPQELRLAVLGGRRQVDRVLPLPLPIVEGQGADHRLPPAVLAHQRRG